MTDNTGDLQDDRKDYKLDELTRKTLTSNPLSLFNT